ncbi:MAG: hypothetical protein ACI837_000486 [Crocinitomicaceae bacterium]|jgi:uncharacterized protein YyaL (SSP411 family)
MEKYTNDLIHESSPYLLQHAHNPVNWVAWSDEVFERAKKEDKLVLISVGYSACHWCHVMEHESFEDEEVAALMNKFFINVKVDREERPDVDQVYMTAVQLMTQKGGWPLNCFTLPDGRPVYGGTYFPKEQWMHILKSLQHTYTNDLEKVTEYAQNLHEGIIASELIAKPESNREFKESQLKELIQRWSKNFDSNEGGNSRAPKFPLPSNYEFLLDYALNTKDEVVRNHVELSLDKMAMGGIYDQIGGGFARYSVDMLWKVPHFEKMLYDNGQLLSLYSKAYRVFKKPLYKRIVLQTIAWLEREMQDESGAFYAALDADSEGVEGKFYVWTKDELDDVLEPADQWMFEFYSINQRGYWEDKNYILLRTEDDTAFCKKMNWSLDELEKRIEDLNQRLMNIRAKRIRPGLDDKCLTSWNAITLKGLCDAYMVFQSDEIHYLILKSSKWLIGNQFKADGSLWRNYKKGTSSVDAFLEDYAHTIAACISTYQVTLDEDWISRAKTLTEYTLVNFQDEVSHMFYFTPSSTKLIARKMEINDNVIPASNSVMARNLFYLGKYFREERFTKIAEQMLANVYDGMEMYGSGYSNWAILLNHVVFGQHEVVVSGAETKSILASLQQEIQTEVVYAGGTSTSEIPILKDKFKADTTLIHVCTDGTCLLPTEDPKEAIKILSNLEHG